MDILVRNADGSYSWKPSNIVPANNLLTVAYTIGVFGVPDVDYNFASVANTAEQSIQIGAAAIMPANSCPIQIIIKCIDGLNGAITGTSDVGSTSVGNDYISAADVDDTNDMYRSTSGTGSFNIIVSASSVYFSFTPSANWNTITTGKWKIWISYIDNSNI